MDQTTEEKTQKALPFNNLFLNSGLVNGINHWSLYVLTISFTAFCYFLSPFITFLHLIFLAKENGVPYEKIAKDPNILQDPVATGIDLNYILLAVFGIFIFTFWGFWFALKKFQHKSFLSVITAYDKFRFKRFWFAFGLWSFAVVIALAIGYFSDPESFKINFNPKSFIISCLLILVFMPFQTGWEEVFFRGYLMQGLALVFKNGWIPLVITALLFGLAHMTNPEVDKYGWQLMLPYFTGFGLFLGILTLLDEGLELAFGIHLANNVVSSILVTSDDSVIKTNSVFETAISDPTNDFIVTSIMMLITFGIFWLKYRWKNFRLILN